MRSSHLSNTIIPIFQNYLISSLKMKKNPFQQISISYTYTAFCVTEETIFYHLSFSAHLRATDPYTAFLQYPKSNIRQRCSHPVHNAVSLYFCSILKHSLSWETVADLQLLLVVLKTSLFINAQNCISLHMYTHTHLHTFFGLHTETLHSYLTPLLSSITINNRNNL